MRLDVLSVAMGVTNSGVGPQVVKGLVGRVLVDGVDVTRGGWRVGGHSDVAARRSCLNMV